MKCQHKRQNNEDVINNQHLTESIKGDKLRSLLQCGLNVYMTRVNCSEAWIHLEVERCFNILHQFRDANLLLFSKTTTATSTVSHPSTAARAPSDCLFCFSWLMQAKMKRRDTPLCKQQSTPCFGRGKWGQAPQVTEPISNQRDQQLGVEPHRPAQHSSSTVNGCLQLVGKSSQGATVTFSDPEGLVAAASPRTT